MVRTLTPVDNLVKLTSDEVFYLECAVMYHIIELKKESFKADDEKEKLLEPRIQALYDLLTKLGTYQSSLPSGFSGVKDNG